YASLSASPRPPTPSLFPYTTLFRSRCDHYQVAHQEHLFQAWGDIARRGNCHGESLACALWDQGRAFRKGGLITPALEGVRSVVGGEQLHQLCTCQLCLRRQFTIACLQCCNGVVEFAANSHLVLVQTLFGFGNLLL